MSNPIQRLDPQGLFSSPGTSQVSVVESGKLAFVSGQVAWTSESSTAPDSLAEQAAIVVSNLKGALASLNAGPEDIVMLRGYLVDMTPERAEEAFGPVFEFLGDVRPSATGIGVQALWAPDLQMEVEIVVRVP